MATSFLLGCCIAQAPTSSVLFQQLGCCGKSAGESHQPQECEELLEAAGWGWVLIPAQGMMGSSHLVWAAASAEVCPLLGWVVGCLLTPQDRQKVGWQQARALSPHGPGCFLPPTMSRAGCLDKEPAPCRVFFVSAGSLGKQVM